MRISTRLLMLLLPTATAVMLLYAWWALGQREQMIRSEARREIQAYARALALGLGDAIGGGAVQQVQDVINRASLEPTVYGVLVYDARGRRIFASDSVVQPFAAEPTRLAGVLRSGQTIALERELDDRPVISVLTPVLDDRGRRVGALEVAQALALIDREKARVRLRYALNTLTLLVVVSLVTLWLVRRTVGVPMASLVEAARAVGAGELGYRIGEQWSGELADLAREFNTMSARLAVARQEAQRETDGRVALASRLRDSEKMAEIGALATEVAHEIAAPLNVISGRSEILLRKDANPEARERHLRIIVQQSGRITAIVRNLLNYARRREAQDVEVDLAEVLDDVAESFESEFGRNAIQFVMQVPRPLSARGDPDLLHQVFVNLLLNAVQALADTVDERRIAVLAEVVSGADGLPRVVLDIRDTGPGVPDALRDQVFGPFFTTKPRGTGLGLSLARAMVEDIGGSIEALASNRGAFFRVTLRATGGADG